MSKPAKGNKNSKTIVPLGPLNLPALRCKMGDRGYFVASFRFKDVRERIRAIPEVHKSKKLSGWIQRTLNDKHASDIAEYLKKEESRFFNAIVVGVYGGDPQWSPLKVSDTREVLSPEDEARLGETIGILTFTGTEDLFPIDGQHRVAGIKKAVADNSELESEEVSVVLVGHAKTDQGLKRTRRLFVTLNQRAKRVSERDIVALDEDNALAIITRQIVDECELFAPEGLMSFSGNASIQEKDVDAITSILALYQIIKAIYPRKHKTWPRPSDAQRARPESAILQELYDFAVGYWSALIEKVPEYKEVLEDGTKKSSEYRKHGKNHFLFRPAGQVALARAVQRVVATGETVEDAVEVLLKDITPWLNNKEWHHILWDPGSKSMLNKTTIAETLLLTTAGHDARSAAAAKKLKDIQKLQKK